MRGWRGPGLTLRLLVDPLSASLLPPSLCSSQAEQYVKCGPSYTTSRVIYDDQTCFAGGSYLFGCCAAACRCAEQRDDGWNGDRLESGAAATERNGPQTLEAHQFFSLDPFWRSCWILDPCKTNSRSRSRCVCWHAFGDVRRIKHTSTRNETLSSSPRCFQHVESKKEQHSVFQM